MAEAKQVVDLLNASLDPRQHRQAEQSLKELESQPSYSFKLLQIAASDQFPLTSRQAAALYFKNFVRRSWTDGDGNHKLPADEVAAIKSQIVGLMISSPPVIQTQLGDAISLIADSDFPSRWTTLVSDLVSRLSTANRATNNGVLEVAHSIFKRWRPLFRSDDLFEEINHVLEHFGQPFMALLVDIEGRISQNGEDKAILQESFDTLNTAIKIIYDLSSQDLPPIFEDNFQALNQMLNKYLAYDNALLHTDDESEAGPLEFVKAGIFEVLNFWIKKYEDAFGEFIGAFVETSWTMLTTLTAAPKYDLLVSRALNFLNSVTSIQHHAENFNNEDTLKQIIERVILPNVSLRESDLELFEDEPIEYTRRDLEGTDSETRRRAATDFLRQLNSKFQERVTALVNGYIDHYLQEYARDRSANWRSKDTAVYLFCSVGAIGLVTAAHGVRTVNPNVNVVDFFQKNIAEDLISDSSHAILTVDAIKFLYIFRSQLSKEQWLEAFPLVAKRLGSYNYVVHTYSAIAIERALNLSSESQWAVLNRSDLKPYAKDMIEKLFSLIEKNQAPEKIQENEFLMRCVMRILIVIRDDVLQFLDVVLTNFVNITQNIRRNPSNPRFYYYMFEAIGAVVRFAAPAQPDKMEAALYEPFALCLQEDVQEFMPYIFQIFAALLEANPTGKLTDYYQTIVPPILLPPLWESKGNAPALVRLLSSMMARGAQDMVSKNQLEPILGIFQNLIAKKSTEGSAFDLLEAIIASFPNEAVQPYYGTIFNLLLTRLQNSRTENLASRFVHLYHFISSRDKQGLGADAVVAVTEQIQTGLFGGLYTSVILPETPKLAKGFDRKLAVISFTKTLADSNAFAANYPKGWSHTCEGMLKLMADPPLPPKTDDIIADQDVDDLSFGVGFTQLNTCRQIPKDPFPDISDVGKWIGPYLKDADSRHNGRITQFVQQRLSPETQNALSVYMQT